MKWASSGEGAYFFVAGSGGENKAIVGRWFGNGSGITY